MDEHHNNGTEERDDRLLALVQAAMAQSQRGFRRPGDECIRAYLLGVASESQQEEMMAALVSSPAFRAEIAEMAKDLACLDDEATRAGFSSASVPEAPDLDAFLKRGTRKRASRPLHAIVESLHAFFTPQRTATLAMVGAAVLAAVLIVPWGIRPPMMRHATGEISGLDWSLPAEAFVPLDMRSAESGAEISEESARDAALRSFAEVVSYDKGQWALRSEIAPRAIRGVKRALLVRALDKDDRECARLCAEIPAAAKDPVAVLLLLPAGKPAAIRMTSDSLDVAWTAALADSGCATFVYRMNGRFGASQAVPFRVR